MNWKADIYVAVYGNHKVCPVKVACFRNKSSCMVPYCLHCWVFFCGPYDFELVRFYFIAACNICNSKFTFEVCISVTQLMKKQSASTFVLGFAGQVLLEKKFFFFNINARYMKILLFTELEVLVRDLLIFLRYFDAFMSQVTCIWWKQCTVVQLLGIAVSTTAVQKFLLCVTLRWIQLSQLISFS